MTYKEFFSGKKIAVVGLGTHMEMIPDIKFLIKIGAAVTAYDIRSEKVLRQALAELVEAGLTKYSFGLVDEASTISDDLAQADLIIISPDVPRDASFLAKAYAAKVRIELPQTLLLKLAPPITVVGIMGSCGKSTVAHMIYSILKKAFSNEDNQTVYHIDPDAPSALSILKTVKKDDIIVARIPAPMAPAYHEARVSPQVSVFTTFSAWVPDFMASTISTILEFQTYNNFIIGSDLVIDQIREDVGVKPKAKMLRTRSATVPADWKIKYRGVYDRENVALALQVAELFKVSREIVRGVLESWSGLRGRLELVKKIQGIEFYNDSASVSPTATLVALRAVAQNKNVTLILGGANTFESYDELIDNVSQYASSVILIPGSGTLHIRRDIALIKDLPSFSVHSIEDAVKLAREHAGRGEAILFSPGFEARGVDISRRERSDQFVKVVRELR